LWSFLDLFFLLDFSSSIVKISISSIMGWGMFIGGFLLLFIRFLSKKNNIILIKKEIILLIFWVWMLGWVRGFVGGKIFNCVQNPLVGHKI
jgi:hypothetical protein